MSAEQAMALPRAELEAGMQLLGLLLFRNELQPETTAAISDLKQGQVRHWLAYQSGELTPTV